MAYHGTVSKGCERCRKRKVKCDQQRPGCKKCSRLCEPCPGYRDVGGFVFRNENGRVLARANGRELSTARQTQPPIRPSPPSSADQALSIPWNPRQLPEDLGANFFFATYSIRKRPFDTAYSDWVETEAKLPGGLVREAVEAVGLAGLSNVSHAPQLAVKANQRYQSAASRFKNAIADRAKAVKDDMLLATTLLALYQTVSFENWSAYDRWAEHMEDTLYIFSLRGEEQTQSHRGGQLFVHCRSQILSLYIQQDRTVPLALVRATYCFENSYLRNHWRNIKLASPGSIIEISFRIINLRSAIKKGHITDSPYISETVDSIDADLQAWAETVPPAWRYHTVDTQIPFDDELSAIGATRYEYTGTWPAEAWNNWRMLRMTINAIGTKYGSEQSDGNAAIIVQMARDICGSLHMYEGNSRALSLIRPLYVIGIEPLTPRSIRKLTASHLKRLGIELGIRHAVLLADKFTQHLEAEAKAASGVVVEFDSDKYPIAPAF